MKMKRFYIFLLGCLTAVNGVFAANSEPQWKTFFAYNEVTTIAVSPQQVYAVSAGSLFSIDKQTELITLYSAASGLSGTDICALYYDEETAVLIIGYTDGKIDVLHNGRMEYISGLYTKDMLATKTINNISVHDGRAYLAMDFGIVTFHLTKHELVDTYYIGANATEVKVQDVVFQDDSIYAFTALTMYKASLKDNIVDYRYWQTEALGRIPRDTNKGKRYTDENGDTWEAGNSEGVVRTMTTGSRLTYKPQGPLFNTPYDMTASQGYLYVVPGGRWATQNGTAGCVMVYDGAQWINLSQADIQSKTGKKALDFMHAEPDPNDPLHFFVTSYGTGVYEFQGSELIQHYTVNNSSLQSAVESNPDGYTRTSGGQFDKKGGLWMMNAGVDICQLQYRAADGTWTGITLNFTNRKQSCSTTKDVLLDNRNENYKWIMLPRATGGLVLVDDNGTLDTADDRIIYRAVVHEANGTETDLSQIQLYECRQDAEGNIWVGSSSGIYIIPETEDFFTSSLCERIDIMEDNGETPFLTSSIYAVAFDNDGRAWIGTTTLGVYVLAADRKSIVAHFTTDNSPMPSNYVMSLAWDKVGQCMYIGTSKGIVSCSDLSTALNNNSSSATEDEIDYGTMQQWRLHYSYTDMQKVVLTPTEVYGFANGTLFAVNKQDETITYYNKSTGLNGAVVADVTYDSNTKQVVICYTDGRIDLLAADGTVTAMPDLYQKASSMAVSINSVLAGSDRVYLAMPFGIVSINPRKAEVMDTYYIGDSAQDVNVLRIAERGDTLYAVSATTLYSASKNDNLLDYAYWKQRALPSAKATVENLLVAHDRLYLMQGTQLYELRDNAWHTIAGTDSLRWVSGDPTHLYFYRWGQGVMTLDENDSIAALADYWVNDVVYDAGAKVYWMAAPERGITRFNGSGREFFTPNGPATNYGYRLRYGAGHIYVAGGARWATESKRAGSFSIYDGSEWTGVTATTVRQQLNLFAAPRDIVSIGADPTDAGHFFACCYGMGLIEFRDYKGYKHYTVANSTLRSAAENNPDYYTRTEGAMVDDEGNLWVLNTGEDAHPVNIMTPAGQWYGLDIYVGRQTLHFSTPWEITQDNRYSNYKWMIDQRSSTGVVLLDDGGTPLSAGDDKAVKRSVFLDGDNVQLSPAALYCLAQDQDGDIWLGTPTGIIIIPSSEDFFASNTCKRIKIPRNDGTNLADYLLGTEQVNAIAVDGANRKWIGTETSGIYLMSADGLTTLAHFTTDNSVLPSNAILSIAIHPLTGEVFVGTASGIASYKSDAAEPHDDLSEAYAYPNPVRPNYQGVITITGLMENTTVNIMDAGGNLVCKTISNGGIAVWDGRNFRGERVGSGVYTALCNAEGKNHTTVKILFMH